MTDKKLNPSCALCGKSLDPFFAGYPSPVCRECGAKAVNAKGQKPRFESMHDAGENPVFIDGKKCWRRYRFGGYVTMLDTKGCATEEEFYLKVFGPFKNIKL